MVRGSRACESAARLLFLSTVLAGCAGGTGSSGPGGVPADPSTTDAPLVPAIFTAEQAERGRRVFGRVCSVCHGRNEFRGPIFALTWMEEPVGHLFQHVSTTMPQDRPGSLTTDEYASVVAYLLELNGRPPGSEELPADVEALNHMRW